MSQADFGLQPVVSPAPHRSAPPRELRNLRDLASIDLVRTAGTLPASPIDRDTQVRLCLPLHFLDLRMPCLSCTSRSRWQLAQATAVTLRAVVQEEKVMAASSISMALCAGMGGQFAADSTQGECAAGQAQGRQPGEQHLYCAALAAAGAGHGPPQCR